MIEKRSITNPEYTIDCEYYPAYLSASVSGEKDSVEISIHYWKDVLQEAHNKKYEKVLVIEDFKNTVSEIEVYLVVEEIIKLGFKNIKVAFVDKQSDQNEINLFGETVAVNRGMVCRVFQNIKKAEVWLKSA